MSSAPLVTRVGDRVGAAHAPCLHGICERKELADEALIWNELVTLRPCLPERAPEAGEAGRRPGALFAPSKG